MYNIGNIITDGNTVVQRFNTDNGLISNNLPTLIIGYEKIRSYYPDLMLQYKNNQINNSTYWTYLKTENRKIFQNDLYNFKQLAYNTIFNQYNVFIDFILTDSSVMYKIIQKLQAAEKLLYCEYDHGFFIIYNKTVLGFNYENMTFSGNKIEDFKKFVLTPKEFIECDITDYDEESLFITNQYQIPILHALDINFF